jgi:hypothetical protein
MILRAGRQIAQGEKDLVRKGDFGGADFEIDLDSRLAMLYGN